MNRFNLECLIEARMERFNYPLEMTAVDGIADFLEDNHKSPLDCNIDDLLVNALIRYEGDEIKQDKESIKSLLDDGHYQEVYNLQYYNSSEYSKRWFINMDYFYSYIYKQWARLNTI